MAAQWRVGSGTGAALSFPANAAEIEAIAKSFEQPPKDPRFQITWSPGPKLHIRIDAADGQNHLNNQQLTLELLSPESSTRATHVIPQTAPGRYEVFIDSPTSPTFASILHQSRLVDRIALPARYPPEFAAIGNDEEGMQELAARTGGAVIPPTHTRALNFDFPSEHVPLTSWLSLAAAFAIASGLVAWRLR
jgi:hypothetical protein